MCVTKTPKNKVLPKVYIKYYKYYGTATVLPLQGSSENTMVLGWYKSGLLLLTKTKTIKSFY